MAVGDLKKLEHINNWWLEHVSGLSIQKSAATRRLEASLEKFNQDMAPLFAVMPTFNLYEPIKIAFRTPSTLSSIKEILSSLKQNEQAVVNSRRHNYEAILTCTNELYSEVNEWVAQHVNAKSSRRSRVLVLKAYLEEQIATLRKRIGPSAPGAEPVAPVVTIPENLKTWWLQESKRGFLSPRTSQTKELDQAIARFCESIPDEAACNRLLKYIDYWKKERQNLSSRAATVDELEQYVRALLAKAPQPVHPFMDLAKATMALALYGLQYIMLDCSSLMDAISSSTT